MIGICSQLPCKLELFHIFSCALPLCCHCYICQHHSIMSQMLFMMLIWYIALFFWASAMGLWLLLSENSLFHLVKLIMSGDIDSTFKRLREWYPQVIKVLLLFGLVVDLFCNLHVIEIFYMTNTIFQIILSCVQQLTSSSYRALSHVSIRT